MNRLTVGMSRDRNLATLRPLLGDQAQFAGPVYDPTYCCCAAGLVVEKLYRAIFHAPSAAFFKMKSSWFASAIFAPAALTVTVPAEWVRANAHSGATWTTSATVNFRSSLIALNTPS